MSTVTRSLEPIADQAAKSAMHTALDAVLQAARARHPKCETRTAVRAYLRAVSARLARQSEGFMPY
jgi:hypothetical protein